MQAQQRVGVVVQRRAHRRWQQRAQRRVQVAGLKDVEQALLVERARAAPAGAVEDRAAECVAAQLRGEAGNVAERVRGDPSARAVRAQLRQHAADRLEGGDREGFGPVAGHHRVEYQRFHVLGVAFGILQRDLRAV